MRTALFLTGICGRPVDFVRERIYKKTAGEKKKRGTEGRTG